jgi:pimeloyl-ACP methyl ester carboxylesterase
MFNSVAQSVAEKALRFALPAFEKLNPGPARLGEKLAAPPAHADPIVLVPGFATDGGYMNVMQRSLEDDGFTVFVFDDPHMGIGSIDEAARGLGGVIDAAKAATGSDKVNLVTYSAGVSVARTYASLQGGATNVKRLTTLDGSWRGDDDSKLIARLRRFGLDGFLPKAWYDLQRTSELNTKLGELPNAGIPDGVKVTTVSPRSAKDSDFVPGATNIEISDRYDHMDLPRASDEAYTKVRDSLLD